MKKMATCLNVGFALLFSVAANAQFDPTKIADAKPGDIRVLASGAVELPLKKVAKEAAAEIGKPLIVQYGGSMLIRDEIMKGQEFEVVLLTPQANNDLRAAGKITAESYEIAVVPIAFGLRGDVSPPDLSTPAAIKATLLKAKAVKYYPTGAALQTVKNVLAKLDIADKIHDASTLKDPVLLGPGEYEINIFPITEILAKKDVKNMGPVISALQVPAIVEAAIGKNATDPKGALALIRYLQGPKFAPALKEVGLQPARSGK